MKTYNELKSLIEQRGVHPEFGDAGEGWGIEQNPHELAAFLVRMQELGVQSVLEIGTGYKGGLSRFLAQDMGWDVTTVDVKNYGHAFEGVHYVVGSNVWFDHKFDLVFIDGDHRYECVRQDYEIFGHEFATKVIAFHDIGGLRDCEGVREFWIEIANHETGHSLSIDGVDTPVVMLNISCNQVLDMKYSLIEKVRLAGIGWIEL